MDGGSIFTHTLWIHRNGLATYDLYLYIVIIVIWVNYDDLTATLTGIMVKKGNHPQLALFQVIEIW